MSNLKIGFLASGAGGNPSGIGDYVNNLDAAGRPAVISARSYLRTGDKRGLFFFEPTSWELLNHAMTCALNAAADRDAEETGAVSSPPETPAAVRRSLAGLYRNLSPR